MMYDEVTKEQAEFIEKLVRQSGKTNVTLAKLFNPKGDAKMIMVSTEKGTKQFRVTKNEQI